MAAKKKKVEEKPVTAEENPVAEEAPVIEEAPVEEKPAVKEEKSKKSAPKKEKKPVSKQKFEIGALAFVAKDVEADLNGFSLFPQYKKEAYTVEAYDAARGVYTLRRQKLLIRLKESDIIEPRENAHDSLNRKQF